MCNNTVFEFTSGKATQPKRFWWGFLTSRHSPRQLILILLWARLYLKRDFLRVLLILRDSLKFAQVISNAAKETSEGAERGRQGPSLNIDECSCAMSAFCAQHGIICGWAFCALLKIVCAHYNVSFHPSNLCVTNGYLHWCGCVWVSRYHGHAFGIPATE